MNIKNKIACRFFLITFFIFASACNTVPTSSSSSSSTAGSPVPSGSSSSSSSGTGAGSQSGSQSTSGGKGAGQQSPAAQEAGSKGTGEDIGEEAQARAGKQSGQGEKSDDEILADALGEFSRETGKIKSESIEQGESDQQAAGIGNDAGLGPGPNAGDNGQGALTNEEKARQLDEQLNRKFAKFDNLMLGEREKVAKGDNEAGSGNGMSGMGDGAGDGDGGDGYAGNDPLQTAMANGSSTSGSLGVKSTRQVDSISEAPPDVGDGQDDDIIARQLREAAQKEQDPELRARLWDEYRKYKKGA